MQKTLVAADDGDDKGDFLARMHQAGERLLDRKIVLTAAAWAGPTTCLPPCREAN